MLLQNCVALNIAKLTRGGIIHLNILSFNKQTVGIPPLPVQTRQ